jgi:hypothetical protein
MKAQVPYRARVFEANDETEVNTKQNKRQTKFVLCELLLVVVTKKKPKLTNSSGFH